MSAKVIVLPVIRRFNESPLPDAPVTRRLAIDLTLPHRHQQRLDAMAHEAAKNLSHAISGIVCAYLDAEAEET